MSKQILSLSTSPAVTLEIEGHRGTIRKTGASREASREEVLLGLKCLELSQSSECAAPSIDASKISLNGADKAVLVLLPGVGVKTAEKIIEARPIGSFHDLETSEVELTAEAKRLVSF